MSIKNTAKFKKILGVDLGVASIGWSLVEKDDVNEGEENKSRILRSGVRIFSQPTDRSGNLLSAQRRTARGQRRMLHRKAVRLRQIRELFVKEGLLSRSLLRELFSKSLHDVWELRQQGLIRKLEAVEWARVLLHIANAAATSRTAHPKRKRIRRTRRFWLASRKTGNP